MATVDEAYAERRATITDDKPSITREYHIRDAVDEQEALAALFASGMCPASMKLSWPDRDGVAVERYFSRVYADIREVASEPHIWTGSVRYGLQSAALEVNRTEPPVIRWTMDFMTESVMQKWVRSQTRYGNGGPDCGNFLNVVNREGRNQAEGANVLVPSGILRGSKTYSAKDWNTVLEKIKGRFCKVNASAFSAGGNVFAAGELLFVGASARGTSDGNMEGEFQFLYSENASGSIDGISYQKNGWQYLWVYSESAAQKNWVIDKAKSVYVADIYESTDFGSLF